jgi:hypothetical protein
MPNVKCPLPDYGHRKRNGYCGRKRIELTNKPHELNELYCLGFDTPEIKIFKEVITGNPDLFQKE